MRRDDRSSRARGRLRAGIGRAGSGDREQVRRELMAKGLAGMPASPGIVDGYVHLLRWEVPDVRHRIIPDESVPTEIERLHEAIARAQERLRHLRQRVEASAGPEEAAIFDVQMSILDDRELTRGVEELIKQNLGAEKAF